MDEPTAAKLFSAIATYAVEHDSYVTKTKLLKLLYLFDVEYYRVHRTTFTGFAWKFFHLGPWTGEFDPMLEGVLATGALLESFSAKRTRFLQPAELTDTRAPFSNVGDEQILRGVLRYWGAAPLPEILDRAYFGTEPMEQGIRNEPLDFSVIPTERPLRYERTPSGVSRKEIDRLRAKFEAPPPVTAAIDSKPHVSWARKLNKDRTVATPPPKYDEEFRKAMATMDEDKEY